jgi:hypothetical protein
MSTTTSEGKGWTPGPWRRATKGNMGNAIEADSGKRSYDGDTGFRVVAMFQACTDKRLASEEDANMEANGALIIAAPDLYEALASIKWRSDDKDNMEYAARITYSQMDAIRAALGKARGEAT